MGRPITILELSADQEAELSRRVRAATTTARDLRRARIVLLRAKGMSQFDVAKEVGTSQQTVCKWSRRFAKEGLDGLKEREGRGVKPSIPQEVVDKVIELAGRRAPGTKRRSTRTTAAEVGISATSVNSIWRAHGLKPHLRRNFKP